MEIIDLNESKQQATESELSDMFGKEHVWYVPGAYLIPHLGAAVWDGHIYVSGATGAGKSYLIKQIVQNDMKKRKVYLFSTVEDDPSLEGIVTHRYDPDNDVLDDTICIFDDYPDKTLSNQILETGRHTNTVAIVVNHKHREWYKSAKAINESKYMVLFPSANKGTALNEMKELGLGPKKRLAIVEYAASRGRYMIIHQHAPNAVICQDTIVVL
jgi:hypothetical protein